MLLALRAIVPRLFKFVSAFVCQPCGCVSFHLVQNTRQNGLCHIHTTLTQVFLRLTISVNRVVSFYILFNQ